MTLSEDTLQLWEFLSYLVTVLGLPLALFAFWREIREDRLNAAKEIEQQEDEIYVSLSQQYTSFLEAALANPELDLLGEGEPPELTPDLRQKKHVYYEMLIALFERAYILLYEPDLKGDSLRRWASWADYMAWWLDKPDFRAYAAANLAGEDPDFAEFVRAQCAKAGTTPAAL